MAQEQDSARVGIHQSESEIHKWDILKTHPSIPELQKGADLARISDFAGAICAFQKAAPRRPSYAYFNLGVIHFETGQLQKAVRYFRLSYKARRDPVCREYLKNSERLLKERGERK
jgi:tetratricopeptide (TPR) repeat protein